jgi:DNA topoisomerase-3
VVKELIESLRLSIEAGDDPPVGRTTKPVTGFRSRAGRSFRAKLALEQNEEGKWRVEFDEEWARGGTPPPAEEDAPAGGAAAEAPAEAEAQPAGNGDGAQQAAEAEPVTSE